MAQETATRFRVSVNDKFLGEKIIQGDNRHAEYHGAFQPTSHTPESLFAAIQEGRAFCAELLKGDCGREHHGQWCCQERREKGDPTHCGRPDGYRHSCHFKSSQVLALDDDARNLSIDELLADSFIAQYATFIYPTISWSPEVRKWRIVFVTTEAITDADVYRKAATALLGRYEATDQQVKDPARLFFGMKRGNGEAVYLGNLLPMSEVLKLVSEYENRRRQLEQETNRRQLPPVDPSKITGNTRDERYASRVIEEEKAWLASRPAGTGERYPSVIPAAQRLASLRASEWLSPEARSQIDVSAVVLEACARNGSLDLYGEAHLMKAIDWGIAHAEPRPVPHDWATEHQNGHSVNGRLHESVPEVEASWPERQSLTERPSAPPLPEQMVPAPFRPWVRDVAGHACIPLEMVATPAIIATSAVVGRQMGIRPSRNDNYLVVPNLWGGPIARPGALKTYAIEEGAKPLKTLAATARERYQAAVEANSSRVARIKAEIEAIKSQMVAAAKGKGDYSLDELEAQLTAKQGELQENAVAERRYITQDATVEKLGELLRDNPRGMLMLRDELAGWLHTMDRAGREGDREVYLEAWNGTGSFTTDRIARGTINIPAMCLSVCGGIQPGKLNAYVREAIAGAEGADGLLQRLQLMVWPDGLGKWNPPNTPPDRDAYRRVVNIFAWLDNINPDLFQAEHEDGGIPAIRFSAEGQILFDQWRTELEYRVRSASLESAPAFESHISKYRSLMPSLALLFHLIAVADGETPGSVSLDAAKLAATWCDYLEAHAKKVYATELYPGMEATHLLAQKIEQGAIRDGEKVRDIYATHHWSGLSSPDQVNMALDGLKEAGWVRVEEEDTGGRPTLKLRLHPDLRGRNG